MHPTMIHKIELAIQKNVPLEVIEELIDSRLLVSYDREWIFRSSVEALDRFLEAVNEFAAAQESA
jgi:hypothetical protein